MVIDTFSNQDEWLCQFLLEKEAAKAVFKQAKVVLQKVGLFCLEKTLLLG